MEELVLRFNESQAEHFVEAVYQGDYFEGLAKLRTAIFAKAAPSFSHPRTRVGATKATRR